VTLASSLSDLYETLNRLAVERRDDVALVSPRGRRMTFGVLHDAVSAAATRLSDEGMRSGDAVMFSVRPSVEAIILILAVIRAGGAIVAADPGMGAELFASRMAAVQPRFVMAESLLYALSSSRVARRLLRRRHLELPQVGRLPGCRFVRVGRWLPGTPPSLDAARLMRPLNRPARRAVVLDSDDAVFVVFTSGTTANPRAVVHTARSIAATLHTSTFLSAMGAHDVAVTDQLHSALPALLSGARVVLPSIGARPADIVRLLHRSRATHAFAFPSDLHRLMSYCERHSLGLPGTLRQIVLGAGPVERPILARLRSLAPTTTQVLCVYGLTEMAPVASVDMAEKIAWSGDGDLVGTPLPGTIARIDARGELHVAGDRLCGRYLGGEPLKEVATGDLAQFDAAGRIVLLGRSKDMIIRGRYNIYPALYEDRIAALPGVARCALIGVWDEAQQDERVVLVLEPAKEGSDTIQLRRQVERALRADSHIDRLALPDEVVVMPLPECGRARKIDRAALRHAVADNRS
jgi:acyl-CoA synthetase (AMP-forming)/AMP-acid ligase II